MAALMPQGKQQYFTAGGIPLVGGKVYTYAAGTTTPLATYTTAAASTPNANPVILDSRGEASIFFSAANYKIVVKDSLDSTIWTQDNLAGDLTGSLAASSGSSLVGHIASGTGAVATTVQAKLRESVSVKDFGAVGDGVTNDTAAIQAAIDYAFSAGVNLTGDGDNYAIGSTLVIPQNSPAPTFETARVITLDFRNSIFTMLADATLFKTSNYGSALDSAYSTGIILTNFGVESAVGQLTQPTLKIQDWHLQCEVSNITSAVSQQMMWANNCFYMTVDNIKSTLVGSKAGDRFIWFNNTNLCKISRLVAGTANTGYRFDGPVTATVMESMSFEGQTIGVAFNAVVYDIAIRDSYFENWSDIAIAFNSYAQGVVIDNNYFNFGSSTAYLLYYAPLPGTNVKLTESNQLNGMTSVANLIKNREDVYGLGIQINLPTTVASSIDDFLVDNAKIGRLIDWREKRHAANYVGHVVNEYATGDYAGKFTDGWSNPNGFKWVDLSSTALKLRTKITQNFVQLVYVNISVAFSGGPANIAGLFIGNQFYKATGASFAPSTDLTGGTDVNGFFQIDGGYYFASALTGVTGEVRMI